MEIFKKVEKLKKELDALRPIGKEQEMIENKLKAPKKTKIKHINVNLVYISLFFISP